MAKFTRAEVRRILGDAHTEDMENQFIALYLGAVDPIKDELAKVKGDAERLPAVQAELDDLKAKGDDGWKEKHDEVKREFDDYKAAQTAKEAKAAKEAAVKAYFESKNIVGKSLDIAMRGSRDEIEALELENGKIKDASALDALIAGDFSGLVGTTTVRGADTANPPANGGGTTLTRADIYKKDDKGRYVMSTAERQRALAANPKLMI